MTAAQPLTLDVHSEVDHQGPRTALSTQLTNRLHKLNGMSGHDLGALLTDVLGGIERSLTPAEALHLVRRVRDLVAAHEKALSDLLIASVNGQKGQYDDFTVVVSAGAAKVDAALLERLHPDVYDEFSIPAVDVKRLKAALPAVFKEVSVRGTDRISVRT